MTRTPIGSGPRSSVGPPVPGFESPAWTVSTTSGEHARVGLGQDAVAEVEDVARLAACRRGGPSSSPRRRRPTGARQTAGSRLPWTALAGADAAAGGSERHAPVDAHHVGSGLGHEAEQLAGADAEVDPGDAEVARALEHLPRGRQHERRRSRRARASPPSCRRAGRRRRRPRPGPAATRARCRPGGRRVGATARARRA